MFMLAVVVVVAVGGIVVSVIISAIISDIANVIEMRFMALEHVFNGCCFELSV